MLEKLFDDFLLLLRLKIQPLFMPLQSLINSNLGSEIVEIEICYELLTFESRIKRSG